LPTLHYPLYVRVLSERRQWSTRRTISSNTTCVCRYECLECRWRQRRVVPQTPYACASLVFFSSHIPYHCLIFWRRYKLLLGGIESAPPEWRSDLVFTASSSCWRFFAQSCRRHRRQARFGTHALLHCHLCVTSDCLCLVAYGRSRRPLGSQEQSQHAPTTANFATHSSGAYNAQQGVVVLVSGVSRVPLHQSRSQRSHGLVASTSAAQDATAHY
jgi:hypothetical protein